MKTLLVAALLLVSAGVASADSIWTYQGQSQNLYSMNPFLQPEANPCGCAMSGMVTLANENTATAWSFTVGQETFDNSNSIFGGWFGFVDPRPFNAWYFSVIGANDSFASFFLGSINDTFDEAGGMFVGSHPGTWSEVVATPEPSSLLLLGAGLLAAILLKANS